MEQREMQRRGRKAEESPMEQREMQRRGRKAEESEAINEYK